MVNENNYQIIFKLLDKYMEIWKSRKVKELDEIISIDIHAYLSVYRLTPDSSCHSLYGIYDFIDSIPKTDKFEYEITNFICSDDGKKVYQYCEVACISSNNDGNDFQYVVHFANVWSMDIWKVIEMRMDINPIDGYLYDEFKKNWLFEPEIAILNGSVHLPCIFSEIDSPYQYDIGDMNNISEVIKRYFYGIDQLHFIHVFNVIDDSYEDGKFEYITKEKFKRQRYRYMSNPYRIRSIENNKTCVIAHLESIIEKFRPLKFTLLHTNNSYKINKMEVIEYGK